MCTTACTPLKETILFMGIVIPMMFVLALYKNVEQFKDQHCDSYWWPHWSRLSYENVCFSRQNLCHVVDSLITRNLSNLLIQQHYDYDQGPR